MTLKKVGFLQLDMIVWLHLKVSVMVGQEKLKAKVSFIFPTDLPSGHCEGCCCMEDGACGLQEGCMLLIKERFVFPLLAVAAPYWGIH